MTVLRPVGQDIRPEGEQKNPSKQNNKTKLSLFYMHDKNLICYYLQKQRRLEFNTPCLNID